MITKDELVDFMPTEEAIRLMHVRYPAQSTFIMDQIMGPHNSAGWFLAGYLFGKDPELRTMGFEEVAKRIEEGHLRETFDA